MNAFHMQKDDRNVAVITVDLPDERMNVLRAEMVDECGALLDTLARDNTLRGVIITSGKPDNFIAGADIRMLSACDSAEDAAALARAGQALFDRLEGFPVPVVAAIHGPCLGGGLELAMACHGRVATDHDATRLGLPEVQLGLLPGSGGTQRLPALVGLPQALDMMLTGRQLRPRQALRQGLVDELVPPPLLMQAARARVQALADGKQTRRRRAWHQRLLENNALGRHLVYRQVGKRVHARTQGNYPAPERIIDAVRTGLESGRRAGLAAEAGHFGTLAMTPQAEALMSLYLAGNALKKDPVTSPSATPRPVRTVGVLGAGLMGAGIAHVTSTQADRNVRLKDVSAERLNEAMGHVHRQIRTRQRRQGLSDFEVGRRLNRITPTLDYSGFGRLDMVIEAVFEDLALKHRMLADVEAHCPETVIFATNTSSIPVAQIAAPARRPERVIGMHYFSPVERMPLLEVIVTDRTDPEVIATTVALGRDQGKTVIVVQDGAGFYVNRILAPYLNEACHLLMEGVPIDHIDTTLVRFGFPMGPFALLDQVGLDVGGKVGPILHEAFGERMRPSPVGERLLAQGRRGRKSGKGFYRHDRRGRGAPKVDAAVYTELGVQPGQRLPAQEIIDRTVLPMINEAVRCHQEGIIRHRRDGDIGAVFGIGFPPFLGGPFHELARRGPKAVAKRLRELQTRHGDRFEPAPGLEKVLEGDDGVSPARPYPSVGSVR
ncbi:fatty acid oxidation complex subunit alpha FadJ [Ectothiorhodospira shaposhnikovii]|uniref:fatty acid oxidation complex subunit alpha FadJ n=1 Tax=Ectothiorhodospira shaposhnikovii TaxID=1054 RepID=UPI001EE87006|nr:fatty acid oxidation complex subunit alpha FadJ [Ectothiorhodospira shaposhnikovii]MCG5514474.1 fatty acid oxidation complex subunit alpha FadJ [Ectothiorhodospira shaposhnikovii]